MTGRSSSSRIAPTASAVEISASVGSLRRIRKDSASSVKWSSVRVTGMVAVVVWAGMVSVPEAAM